MQFHRIKQSYIYKENKTNTWSKLIKQENVKKLEALVDDRLQRRFQTWCRACVSEHCRLESKREETCRDSGENCAVLLQTMRDKRKSLEKYMSKVDKLINVCQDHILRAYNLSAPKSQLPDWLTEVLQKDLTFPLVPTFPISAVAFNTLYSDVGLDESNDELLGEYLTAGSFVRRLKLIPGILSHGHEDDLHFDNMIFTEEISQISSRSKKFLTSKEDQCRVSATELGSARSVDSSSETCEKMQRDLHRRINLRAIEKQLAWTVAYNCTDAKIEKHSAHRAYIAGQMQVEPDKSDNHSGRLCLPFKLILLFDSGADSGIKVKGIYLRRSTVSPFDLRWKYDVEFDIATSSVAN